MTTEYEMVGAWLVEVKATEDGFTMTLGLEPEEGQETTIEITSHQRDAALRAVVAAAEAYLGAYVAV